MVKTQTELTKARGGSNLLDFRLTHISGQRSWSVGRDEKRQLKGIYPEFQVIRGFSQKILADLLSYDQIHS